MSRHKWGKMVQNSQISHFLLFLAIFHRLCLLMDNLFTPSLLLSMKMVSLPLGAVALISVKRKLLKDMNTPFSQHLPKNSIFGHFSPFVPAHGQPLDPTSAFIDITIITGCHCNDIYGERATPGYYNPIFLPYASNSIVGHFWPFFTICVCSWVTP